MKKDVLDMYSRIHGSSSLDMLPSTNLLGTGTSTSAKSQVRAESKEFSSTYGRVWNTGVRVRVRVLQHW